MKKPFLWTDAALVGAPYGQWWTDTGEFGVQSCCGTCSILNSAPTLLVSSSNSRRREWALSPAPVMVSCSRRCTSTLLSWRGSRLRLRSGGYAGTRRVSPAGIPCLARAARGTAPNPAPGPERPPSASGDQRHLRATAGADPSDDEARRGSKSPLCGTDPMTALSFSTVSRASAAR